MKTRFLILGSCLTLLIGTSRATSRVEDKSCREHPQLVGSCFNVHGKLSVYNGAPALRIARIGTKRILGVSEQRFSLAGYRNIPEEVRAKIDQDKVLIGDFLVCPFTPQRKKEMQMVCIEKATNLVVKDR